MNQYQNPYYMVPQRRPRAWVNGTLIVLNILYFLYLELTGSTEDAYFMLEHGAMYGPFVLRGHEYYRLLTSMFMHFGINHIVNNMLVLFVLGDNLERALGKVKYLIYQVKIIMQSFYPLMLNTAKRSRTTVEALELRGYRYAAVNKSVKKIKLAALKVSYNDGLFLAISFLVVAVAVLISTLL